MCCRVLFVTYCVMAYGSLFVFVCFAFVCVNGLMCVCLVCDLLCGVVWFVVALFVSVCVCVCFVVRFLAKFCTTCVYCVTV